MNQVHVSMPMLGSMQMVHRSYTPQVACLLMGVFVLLFQAPVNAQRDHEGVSYINARTNVWHLETMDDGDLVVADYDGVILRLIPGTNEVRWRYRAGAFVFELRTADLDRDGRREVLAATANGELVVLDGDGNKRWSFQSSLPLYNVAAGNFAGDDHLEVVCGGIDRHVYVLDARGSLLSKSEEVERIVHRIAVGNLDDQPHDEILVIANRTEANLMAIRNGSLTTLWKKRLQVPKDMVNWENPGGNFYPFSIVIDDLDGDGANEIIMGDTYFNKQAVMVADANGEPKWISPGVTPFQMIDGHPSEFYSTAFVRTADIDPSHPGKEVIAVAGGYVRVWNRDGKLLGAQNSALGFTDVEVSAGQLLLGSCPNGDTFVYRIDLSGNWKSRVAALEFRGLIADIRQSTRQLKDQVLRANTPPDKNEIYQIRNEIGVANNDPTALEKYLSQKKWFEKRFPYANLSLVNSMRLMETDPPVDENGEPWSLSRWRVDAIHGTDNEATLLAKARWIETNRIPTIFTIGHSCMPFISLATVKKVLAVAPRYTMGFITMEDEQVERLPRYFEHYMSGLAALCRQHGNKLCITKNKGLWWLSVPAHKAVYDAFFSGGNEAVAMAATEDSNSRTPEINLMARGGLWQAGLIRHNDVSVHADLFSFNRFHQWEYPRIGSPYLRLLVAHTVTGMTQVSTRLREVTANGDGYAFNRIGEESTELFYHLLGKGVVVSPSPSQSFGYSPVGLAVHQPPGNWMTDAHNGHAPEKWQEDSTLHQAVLPHNGSLWGMTNTPPHAIQAVAFNKQRQFGYQVPPTPYGLVAMVPAHAPLSEVPHVEEWWHTDGVSLWKPGQPKLTGEAAATALRRSLENGAGKLPLRQTGDAVFLQVIKLDDDHYRAYFVDPGWLDPKEREVTVHIQLPGKFDVSDVLSGTAVRTTGDKTFSVTVPAGLFRVIDLSRTGAPLK